MYMNIIHLEMILNDMEKWLISPKTRYMTINSGLAAITRLAQLSHCFSANTTSTIFNVQKRIFSLSNDDFAHVIGHASVLDVTLMRIYEVAQNCKLSTANALFSKYICI